MAWLGLALGLGLGAACGTDPEPSREPLGTTASATPDGGADALPAGGFPCDVHAVLEASCARCHTGETYAVEYTVPADWRASLNVEQTFGAYAVARMRDPQYPMPPSNDGGPRPTPAEIDVVAAWVEAGMPDGTCGPLTPPR